MCDYEKEIAAELTRSDVPDRHHLVGEKHLQQVNMKEVK